MLKLHSIEQIQLKLTQLFEKRTSIITKITELNEGGGRRTKEEMRKMEEHDSVSIEAQMDMQERFEKISAEYELLASIENEMSLIYKELSTRIGKEI